MILVNIVVRKGIIERIEMKGHAMFNDYGKDIVCAGVSSALITTVNAILSFDKNSIEYKNDNHFSLINIKKDKVTNNLLENLVEILKQTEKQYSKNIKVKEENYE